MSDETARGAATEDPLSGEQHWPIVAREGWPIIAAIALFSVLLGAAAGWLAPAAGAGVGLLGLVVTLWAVWFFRDPERRTPTEPGLVISSADGVVCFVGPGDPPAELGLAARADARGMTRVSVFMNIFNVHVNRSPAPGRVSASHYRPGKFFNASLDKASEHNERQSLALELEGGGLLVVVQIAGLIARRIVCRAKAGTRLGVGERFGLIRFGSRVDVYLPAGVAPLVRIGDRSVAGETVLARLQDAGSGGAARGA